MPTFSRACVLYFLTLNLPLSTHAPAGILEHHNEPLKSHHFHPTSVFSLPWIGGPSSKCTWTVMINSKASNPQIIVTSSAQCLLATLPFMFLENPTDHSLLNAWCQGLTSGYQINDLLCAIWWVFFSISLFDQTMYSKQRNSWTMLS